MHPSKFGDSYDIVKQSILGCLKSCGDWSAHPMVFTGPFCPSFAEKFSDFLGIPLLESEAASDRKSLVETANSCPDHLFLDPDTGLDISTTSKFSKEHLRGDELIRIAKARKDKLTLVFDQSYSRADDRHQKTKEKLNFLKNDGVHSIAYYSHANFILASPNEKILDDAKHILMTELKLPHKRIIEI